jgi:anaerobic magnesium-protoporphyrin IX monomethyl ester cyclase
MKIVFVTGESKSYEISLFSSLLKLQGHEVYLVFDPIIFKTNEINNKKLSNLFDIKRRNIEKIVNIKPDLIGFSVYTKDYQWSLMMARLIKQEINVPIIFGGAHCTIVPEEVVKADVVDIMCVGEGEYALSELVNSMEKGEINHSIKNLWFKTKEGAIIKNDQRPLIQDLDSLPFPDGAIFFEQKPILGKGYIMSSGRGCPFHCTFCASGYLTDYYSQRGLGKYVRQRSVNSTIKELVWAKNKYNFDHVAFTDDVFTLNTDWLKDFSIQYKQKINIPFFCTANPGTITDEQLRLLKSANCEMMGFGFQSASENTRINILQRGGKNKRILEVAKLCHQLGIKFWFDHILNIPEETEKEQLEALQFYNESRPDVINTFWLTYFPKTKIAEIALEKGIIDKETLEKINRGETSLAVLRSSDCRHSSGKKEMFETFSFLFTALPLMPKWMVNGIIKRRWYRSRIKVPFLIKLMIKDLARIKIGRYADVTFPLQYLVTNMIDNIKIKLGI